MVENLPASAGDMGLIPGLGRFHMLRGSWACDTTTEPNLESLCSTTESATTMRNLCTATRERARFHHEGPARPKHTHTHTHTQTRLPFKKEETKSKSEMTFFQNGAVISFYIFDANRNI